MSHCRPSQFQPFIQPDLAAVRDHRREYPDLLFVYPVISRRSRGLSIGINLNPDKRCNFNCVYCEVDRTRPGLPIKPTPERVEEELEWMIEQVRSGQLAEKPRFQEAPELARTIRDFAFSGDGEPTLVPNFDAFARTVATVRRRHGLEQAKIVLITNAVSLDKQTVQAGLRILQENNGEIWAKLDAGTPAYFQTINRSPVRFERILRNITQTARWFPLIIQSLFLRWQGQRMPPEELEAYCARLNQILQAGGQIQAVHAYTIARPAPEPEAKPLTARELEEIAAVIRQRTGLPVEIFP